MEEWLRSRGVLSGGAAAALEPLIQAVQLLQTGKKTEADAQALVQTCTALSSQQVALCSSTVTLVASVCLSLWHLIGLYRLWRFWPCTPHTVTWMKGSRWTSFAPSRYVHEGRVLTHVSALRASPQRSVSCRVFSKDTPMASPRSSWWTSDECSPSHFPTRLPLPSTLSSYSFQTPSRSPFYAEFKTSSTPHGKYWFI